MDLVVSSGRNGSKKLDRDWIGPALPHLRPARLRVPFPAIAAALALVCVAVWCAVVIDAAQAGRTIWSGIYSEAQARRGEEAYKLECAYCHQPDLSGGFFDNGTGRAPALAGPKAFDSSFVDRWLIKRSANSSRPSPRRCRSRSRRACPSRPTSTSRPS